MALPKFDKSQRRKNFEQLPKGAYVVKIMGAVQEPNRNGKGEHVKIIVDIAEGDFKGYFSRIYEANTNEDKKWPNVMTARALFGRITRHSYQTLKTVTPAIPLTRALTASETRS